MNYSTIKKYDVSNGYGVRTSIFVCGCTHYCHNCFNKEIWKFDSGKLFDEDAEETLMTYLSDAHCKGLSVLGGEPLLQGNDMLDLLKKVKERFPQKDIWLWSGFTMEQIKQDKLKQEIISYCDYVIDGKYIESLGSKKILFRGSSNQIIWEKNKDGVFEVSKLNEK